MKTFHFCWLWLLGSTCLSEPYQTASARPAPPALIHGKTFVASPLAGSPSLTWTGAVQLVQPDAAVAALTKTWRRAGSPGSPLAWLGGLIAHAAMRLRPLSIETTEKSVSGEPLGVSAILISCVRSCEPLPVSSRKCSVPVLSGVPTFSHSPVDLHPLAAVQPAASKTLPLTWSMAG